MIFNHIITNLQLNKMKQLNVVYVQEKFYNLKLILIIDFLKLDQAIKIKMKHDCQCFEQ